MALGFSSGLLTGLQQYGQGGGAIPRDPRERNAMQAAGVTNPLLQQFGRGLGGLFGTEMRSPQQIASSEVSTALSGTPEDQMKAAQRLASLGYTEQAMKLIEAAKATQKEKTKIETASSFRSSLSSILKEKGQTGFANVVDKVPDFSSLPAEAQSRILAAAGITDPEDQKKALSTEGKLAVDLGFKVGTPAFISEVERLNSAKVSGLRTDALEVIRATVNDVADLKKNAKITDAVVAIASGGKAGAEALQENTIIDLFGSKLRAESAVKRFSQSASLPRRVVDSISQWATGEKTQLTVEDREAIIYAAMQVQQETIDNAVTSTASSLKIPESEAESIRKIYDYPESVKEWQKRYEQRFIRKPQEQKEEAPDYVSQYLQEAMRKRQP